MLVFCICPTRDLVYATLTYLPPHDAVYRALVATLIGLLMSNFGLIPFDAAQYAVVNKMLLPLAIPMLLFSADLRSYCEVPTAGLLCHSFLRLLRTTAIYIS